MKKYLFAFFISLIAFSILAVNVIAAPKKTLTYDHILFLPSINKDLNTRWRGQAILNQPRHYRGVRAYVTVADPIIREAVFSYETVQLVNSTAGKYIEMGWWKSLYSDNHCHVRFTATTQANDLTHGTISNPTPTIGNTYLFQIENTSGNNWSAYIFTYPNNTLIATWNFGDLGYSEGDYLYVGGEVWDSNKVNEMGISYQTNVSYKLIDGNGNSSWPYWNVDDFVADPPYDWAEFPAYSVYNFINFGNQGTPVPTQPAYCR